MPTTKTSRITIETIEALRGDEMTAWLVPDVLDMTLIEQLNDYEFTIMNQMEHPYGVSWLARITTSNGALNVSNRGDGGCNWYDPLRDSEREVAGQIARSLTDLAKALYKDVIEPLDQIVFLLDVLA